MTNVVCIEAPRGHLHAALRRPTCHLVINDFGGSTIARLFTDTRNLLAEFDADAEEVATVLNGLKPLPGALGNGGDRGFEGHKVGERATAEVRMLDV